MCEGTGTLHMCVEDGANYGAIWPWVNTRKVCRRVLLKYVLVLSSATEPYPA